MTLRLEIGRARRAKPGERACGDQIGVVVEPQRCFIAVADGLGHGEPAAEASEAAVRHLLADPWGDLVQLVKACDRALAQTRGVALTILRIDAAAKTVSHVAVGNVEVACRMREPAGFVALPGVVGSRLRKVVENRRAVHPGDVFVVHSDGISSRFAIDHLPLHGADAAAQYLLAHHAKEHDDAACVVVRC